MAQASLLSRPSIPEDIRQQVLVESGHRCAVCGAVSPLEVAHIIPWRSCKTHEAANLICLCASCHARADLEKWSRRALLAYKSNPWVHLHTQIPPLDNAAKVEISIELEMEKFDAFMERHLQFSLAGFLGISPDSIRIIAKREGSVILTIKLPSDSCDELTQAFNLGQLEGKLGPFVVNAVKILEKPKKKNFYLRRVVACVRQRHSSSRRQKKYQAFRNSYKALIVVGNGEGVAGFGISTGRDQKHAISMAAGKAKRKLISVPLVNGTIPRAAYGTYGTCMVLLKPASPPVTISTESRVIEKVAECFGIRSILGIVSDGHTPEAVLIATFAALESIGDFPKALRASL